MILRPALLLSVLLPLAACTGQDASPAPSATSAPAAAAPTEAPAPTATPEATTPAPAEPVPATVAEVPVGPAPVAGADYVEISGGQPFEPASGKIEVVEIFSYTCPHCASFEPMLTAWRAKQTADVKFTAVAGPFGANPIPFAKAFYAAQSLGLLGKTHDAMFRAIHIEQSLPLQSSNEQIVAFYAKHGANPEQFASTMSSFAVDAKQKRAIQFMQRSGVDSSPSIIVEGKYRVTGKSLEDVLRITTHLVAQERAARGG